MERLLSEEWIQSQYKDMELGKMWESMNRKWFNFQDLSVMEEILEPVLVQTEVWMSMKELTWGQ